MDFNCLCALENFYLASFLPLHLSYLQPREEPHEPKLLAKQAR